MSILSSYHNVVLSGKHAGEILTVDTMGLYSFGNYIINKHNVRKFTFIKYRNEYRTMCEVWKIVWCDNTVSICLLTRKISNKFCRILTAPEPPSLSQELKRKKTKLPKISSVAYSTQGSWRCPKCDLVNVGKTCTNCGTMRLLEDSKRTKKLFPRDFRF